MDTERGTAQADRSSTVLVAPIPPARSRRRSALVLTVATLVGVAAFLGPFALSVPRVVGADQGAAHAADAPLVFAALGVLCLLVLLVETGGRDPDAKQVALLGVLVATNAALRLVPDILGASPIYFLPIAVGFIWGPSFGFLLGAASLALSSLLTGGVGPWMPFQMLTLGWVGMTAGLLGTYPPAPFVPPAWKGARTHIAPELRVDTGVIGRGNDLGGRGGSRTALLARARCPLRGNRTRRGRAVYEPPLPDPANLSATGSRSEAAAPDEHAPPPTPEGRRGPGGRCIIALAIFAGVWGFLYGAIMNLWFWPFAAPSAPGDAGLYWAPGLGLAETVHRYAVFYLTTSAAYDASRAIGNVAMVLLFGRPVLLLLSRFRRRFTWQPVIVDEENA